MSSKSDNASMSEQLEDLARQIGDAHEEMGDLINELEVDIYEASGYGKREFDDMDDSVLEALQKSISEMENVFELMKGPWAEMRNLLDEYEKATTEPSDSQED